VNSLFDILEQFRDKLIHLYPKNEIDSIFFLVINHILGFSRSDYFLNSYKIIELKNNNKIFKILDRLETAEPVQYILNSSHFYNLNLYVDKRVLIPRSETEELVDWVIKDNIDKELTFLDIGTGSGCISIALSKHLTGNFTAIDISNDAVDIAMTNSNSNNVNIDFIVGDIFKHKFITKFDVIVSNPPYVLNSEKINIHKNVLKYEPSDAIFVKNDSPLIFYERIIDICKKYMNPKGLLYLEINHVFGSEICNLLSKSFFVNIELKKDINGKDRMIKAVRK